MLKEAKKKDAEEKKRLESIASELEKEACSYLWSSKNNLIRLLSVITIHSVQIGMMKLGKEKEAEEKKLMESRITHLQNEVFNKSLKLFRYCYPKKKVIS